jgi:ribosomal protein S18 acetylase RimI-like enzyme
VKDAVITIRLATPQDAALLPDVEQSAGSSFRAIPDIAWVADGENMAVDRHLHCIDRRTEWVAEIACDEIVGFLAAEVLADELHIWEFAVSSDHQRRGIGPRLLNAAVNCARAKSLRALTLTTFAHVPWNGPWYLRLGFQSLTASEMGERLAAVLRDEMARGLPQRIAMRMRIE